MAFSTEDMNWAQRDKVRRDREAARARGELPPKINVDVIYGNGAIVWPKQHVRIQNAVPGEPVRGSMRKAKPHLARSQVTGKPPIPMPTGLDGSVTTKPNSVKRRSFRVRAPAWLRIFVIGYDAWIGEAIQAEIKRHDPSLR